MSNKLPLGKQDFKHLIGHKDAKRIRPLCIFHPKMSIYKRDIDEAKCMYFLIKSEKKFYKFNEIWEKVSNIIKNELNSEHACNKEKSKS